MSEPPHTALDYATPRQRPRRRVGLLITLLVLMFLLGVSVPLLLWRSSMRYTAVGTVTITPASGVAQTSAAIAPTTPAHVTIVQRGEQQLPGTNGAITARIGDITGGQVLLTIEDSAGQFLVNTVSMREGAAQSFTVGKGTFEIQLVELKNFLTSDDFAVFAIRQSGTALSEPEKIKRLIDAIANAQGLTFIRNGSPHDPADAAAHLRRKYEAAKNREVTSRQFIEHIASQSSTTGEAYRVRLPGGSELTSAEWLTARLREIESQPASTQAAK